MPGWYDKYKSDRRQQQGQTGVAPKYQVLQADLLKPSERDRAAAVASFIESGDDAAKLAGHEGFAYRGLDIRNRVGVVLCKGVEVMLLFERAVHEIEPGEADPVPEKILRKPADRWLRISLLNTSDTEVKETAGSVVQKLRDDVARLRILWNDATRDKAQLQAQVERLEPAAAALINLKVKVKTMEDDIEQAKTEAEAQKRIALLAKQEKSDFSAKSLEELFPIYNTLWLARQNRENDKLYGILIKQMQEAFTRLGATLLEPKSTYDNGVPDADDFNPEEHHAVHGVQQPQGSMSIGKILQVHKVGLRVGARLILPVDVTVGIETKEEAIANGVTN